MRMDFENGREVARTEKTREESPPAPRARRVAEFDADRLICGAISRPPTSDAGALWKWPFFSQRRTARPEAVA